MTLLTTAARAFDPAKGRRPEYLPSTCRVVRRVMLRALAAIVFCWLALSPAMAEVLVDGVPLPADAVVSENSAMRSDLNKRFLGAWVGAWGDSLKHILVIERISPDGEASAIYANGDLVSANVTRSWKRYKGTIAGDTLTISANFTVTYRVAGNTLRAIFERGAVRSQATMSRADLAILLGPGARIAWSRRQVEFLDTGFVESGKPVRLEVVLFKPEGNGPFPLLVFNHGSTGEGRRPDRFTRTSWNFGLAEYFREKGWMVAFPQRRGRGRSDGLYDEGFAPLRSNGYSCDPPRSLPGADRGLDDVEAAVGALLRRSDVSPGPVLMGGVSRGGVLSIAYAGKHPKQVLGVINFVGGWVGEGCGNADRINKTLFQRGAAFGGPTLWLYGRGDRYYSIGHSRSNFDAYQAVGGKGTFLEFDVGAIDGHDLIANPQLWKQAVDEYVESVRR